jgi:hypothetical protein
MLVASKNGMRVRPSKTGERAGCPVCGAEVVSRCGEINVWHWAHRAIAGCDPWIEAETEWHSNWKSLVPENWIEIVIEKDGRRRCADIRLPNGRVVKLQRAPLSPEEIRDYERFFGDMVWIFDVRESRESLDAYGLPRLDLRKKDMSSMAKQLHGVKDTPTNYRTFRWKHPRKHIAFVTKPVFLDIGENKVFRLDKLYPERPSGGFGFLFNVKALLAWFKNQA